MRVEDENLQSAVLGLTEKIEESIAVARATNMLLLGKEWGLDPAMSVMDAQKLRLHLETLEKWARAGVV